MWGDNFYVRAKGVARKRKLTVRYEVVDKNPLSASFGK